MGPQDSRHKTPQVDGIADAKENIPFGQLSWPLGPVDLALELENHLRQPLLRRVQIHVLWLPASHLSDTLQSRQVVLKPRATVVAVFPPLPQQVPQEGTEPPSSIHRPGLGVDGRIWVLAFHLRKDRPTHLLHALAQLGEMIRIGL